MRTIIKRSDRRTKLYLLTNTRREKAAISLLRPHVRRNLKIKSLAAIFIGVAGGYDVPDQGPSRKNLVCTTYTDCKPLTSDLSRNDRQCAKVLQFKSSGAIGSWSHQTPHSIVFKWKKQNLQRNFARWGRKKTRLTARYYGHFFMAVRHNHHTFWVVKRTSLIKYGPIFLAHWWPYYRSSTVLCFAHENFGELYSYKAHFHCLLLHFKAQVPPRPGPGMEFPKVESLKRIKNA